MRHLIGGLCMAVMLLATPALADTKSDETERLALANKFIALLQVDQLSGAISQMTTMMMPQEFAELPADDAQEMQDLIAEMTADMMPRMFEAMAPAYADIFTLEELRGLVAFYESDIGRSMIRKSYEATPQLAEAMQSIMPSIMADMADTMCDRFECSADERREVKAAMTGAVAAR